METDEDRRQEEAKDQGYQAIWGVGRESGQNQSKTEAINAMMMIITVGSNCRRVAAESTSAAHHNVFQGTSDGWAKQRETDGQAERASEGL